jgi:hypothetical protein
MPDAGRQEEHCFLFLASGIFPPVIETTHFINQGFGWVCKHCSALEEAAGASASVEGRARFFTEGEAETGEAHLFTTALARWTDATRRALVCPRCSIEETISKV